MTIIETINKTKVNDVLIHNGKGMNGFKVILSLNNGKVLYFNSLWMHYFDVKDLKKKHSFIKIEVGSSHIEKIYCFEGVGFYIVFSGGIILNIFEKIINLDELNYRYDYKIVKNTDKKAFNEMLNDIIEMEEPDDVIQGPPKFW